MREAEGAGALGTRARGGARGEVVVEYGAGTVLGTRIRDGTELDESAILETGALAECRCGYRWGENEQRSSQKV